MAAEMSATGNPSRMETWSQVKQQRASRNIRNTMKTGEYSDGLDMTWRTWKVGLANVRRAHSPAVSFLRRSCCRKLTSWDLQCGCNLFGKLTRPRRCRVVLSRATPRTVVIQQMRSYYSNKYQNSPSFCFYWDDIQLGAITPQHTHTHTLTLEKTNHSRTVESASSTAPVEFGNALKNATIQWYHI